MRRILATETVPLEIRQLFFRCLDDPKIFEVWLAQEIVSRATLDACGVTGLSDVDEHDSAVREARLWFRLNDDNAAEDLCDIIGIDFIKLRRLVLQFKVTYKIDMEGGDVS